MQLCEFGHITLRSFNFLGWSREHVATLAIAETVVLGGKGSPVLRVNAELVVARARLDVLDAVVVIEFTTTVVCPSMTTVELDRSTVAAVSTGAALPLAVPLSILLALHTCIAFHA